MRLLTLWLENEYVLDHRLVCVIWGPLVRQIPCHTCLTGSIYELHFGLFWSVTTQSNDQRILAFECLKKRLWLVIIDILRNHAFWQLVLATDPCDSRNGVLASLEQGPRS